MLSQSSISSLCSNVDANLSILLKQRDGAFALPQRKKLRSCENGARDRGAQRQAMRGDRRVRTAQGRMAQQ